MSMSSPLAPAWNRRGILAEQLTRAGLTVVSLERGEIRDTALNFSHDHDELRYQVRRDMMINLQNETWTWRPSPRDTALPMRQYGSFNPGRGTGGAGVHWAAQHWRFYPSDFQYRTHHIERYGADKLPAGNRIQDWPVTYDEMEKYYDAVDYDIGVSGIAGNLNGEQIEGGNVFEGARSRDYPMKPLPTSLTGNKFTVAANELGYHPFPQPSAILSEDYKDLAGNPRGACLLCGFCTRFGCEVGAKASSIVTHMPAAFATGKYEIRPNCYVYRINVDSDGKATGVSYIDPGGRTQTQTADIVIVSAYTLTNVRLLLMSTSNAHADGIGNDHGLVGKNYTYQLGGGGSSGLFDGERLNQFMGNSCNQALIHDFNADNFDHSDLDFIGGASIGSGGGDRTPISSVGGVPTQNGATWGKDWKDSLRSNWDSIAGIGTQGESLPYEDQYLDLDPTYRDRFGLPLLRLTFDWHENDYNMIRYLSPKIREILERMGATNIHTQEELQPYSIAPYRAPTAPAARSWGQSRRFGNQQNSGRSGTAECLRHRRGPLPAKCRHEPHWHRAGSGLSAGDGIANQYVNAPGELITG